MVYIKIFILFSQNTEKYRKMTPEHNAVISIFLSNNYALGYFSCYFQIYSGFLKNGQGFSLSKFKKSYGDLN
jgi:hypothetical protein